MFISYVIKLNILLSFNNIENQPQAKYKYSSQNTFFVIFVGFFLHFVFLIVQKYRPVWVSDLVPYQNQHNGFSSILYCSTVSNPTKSRCLKKEVQTGFYLPPLGSTEK